MKLLRTVCLLGVVACLAGCQEKKKVVDVQTPVGDVEVTENQDTGEVQVEVNGEEQQP